MKFLSTSRLVMLVTYDGYGAAMMSKQQAEK